MKLADHTDVIRQLIDKSFRNRLGRMGIQEESNVPIESIPYEYHEDRKRIETIFDTLIEETNHKRDEAYEKLVEEFTFTLFNRLAALKVMEAHTLHPEIVTRRSQHGGRSFAHLAWLEENPDGRNAEQEGLNKFLENQFAGLAKDINLFSLEYPYHLLPTAIELNQIIEAFNAVAEDKDVEENIWQSDDVMGWLYESYNNYKKIAHKASKAKTEYNKVSIQSQVYTPRWVVKFLVDNSLGKLYLEMFPASEIKNKYQIANAPDEQIREAKPLTEIKLIDPACGSANFLLYAFDLFYDLYLDQIENYGADMDEREIPDLIIQHNLYGIDLDDRAVQIAQLGLYIKAKRRRRTARISNFNVVSSDFFLPGYSEVKELFETDVPLKPELEKIVNELWTDLQQAHKFGALLRIEEKFNLELESVIEEAKAMPLAGMYEETISDYYKFRSNFFDKLHSAVKQHNKKFGSSFLSVKTADAITFLELLTQKYDVSVANPPYTSSSEYGVELRDFIEANYKERINSYENLYSSFFVRLSELTSENGYLAMITPQTFMFISSFKEIRKFILENCYINLFVQYGFGGIFKESVDPAFYVIRKGIIEEPSVFIKLDQIFNDSKNLLLQEILNSYLQGEIAEEHVYEVYQRKMLDIPDQPLIYWISDHFREKFSSGLLDQYMRVCQGLATSDNSRFLRFHWEIDQSRINSKWFYYAKGGKFNKWQGNLWLTINWENDGKEVKGLAKSRYGSVTKTIKNIPYYFKEGISYSASGRGGYAFRYLPKGCVFDVGGSSIFLTGNFDNIYYSLGLMNSKLSFFIADCLNPTANIQVGDIKRIPFVIPDKESESKISSLAEENVHLTEQINSLKIVEPNYNKSPILFFRDQSIINRVSSHLDDENAKSTLIILNEAIINRLIFAIYELNSIDKLQVSLKMGSQLGDLPVSKEARDAFLSLDELLNQEIKEFIRQLPIDEFETQFQDSIKNNFATLYKSNSEFEEFCIRHQVNPINVWYWFKQSNVIPKARANEIALEFLADVCRTVLMEDADGIAPLVGLPGETALLDRLEQKCLSLGLSSAQFAQLDGLLGRPVKEYLEHHFFKNLSDHLNLFMYLPKTPFIWHLSSGELQGFEAYIIIYKWTRDSLYRLKSKYISDRTEALNYRLSNLADSNTAQAQISKETITLQLQEIKDFTAKVDELIAEDYNPKLDDGVGKNIAPLQNKGMLRADVLSDKQLEKYLNADW